MRTQTTIRNARHIAVVLLSHVLHSPLCHSAIYKQSPSAANEGSPRQNHTTYKQESQWIDLTSLHFTCQPPCCLSVRSRWPIKTLSFACDVYSFIFLCLILTCPDFVFFFFLWSFSHCILWGEERVRMTVGECNRSWQWNICHKGITVLWWDSQREKSSLY